MARILIIDDFPIVRQGIIEALKEDGVMRSCDEAASASDALAMINENEYDVVLLDINMPGRSGIDVLKDIKELKPRLPILIITMYPEDQYAVRAMKAGAAGYLNKTQDISEIAEAIHQVLSGRKYVTDAVAAKLADAIGQPTDRMPHELLSDREYDVFLRLASGQTVSVIADKLALSVKTVSTYRARILDKMNLKHNSDMTLYAVQHKLME